MLHHYFNDTSCSKETYSQSAAINKGMKHWSKVLFIGACTQQMFALHSPFPLVFHLSFSNRSYIRCTLYRKRSVKSDDVEDPQWVNSQFFPCIVSPPQECGNVLSSETSLYPTQANTLPIPCRFRVQRLQAPGGVNLITRESINPTQRAFLVCT